MKLSEVKKVLATLENVDFELENGMRVPAHFHITEVGEINKKFIDCGGVVRNEAVVNFQLWEAGDYDHRLSPSKLLNIIRISEEKLGIQDLEVEVEYQSNTIGKYHLEFNGTKFILLSTNTNCLASDSCGIPAEKLNVNFRLKSVKENSCTPGGGCC